MPGFTTLPAPTVCLFSERNASVWLTSDPDALCIHADRASALVELLGTSGLKNGFDERFVSALAEVRSQRKQRARSHAWLVTDAFLDACPRQGVQRELPGFAYSIDCVSEETRDDLARLADSALGRVVAGLSIILGEARFPDIKKVNSAIYFLQPGNPSPTYDIKPVLGSPSLSIPSPASEDLIASLADCIRELQAVGVETALRLHKAALESDDHLRAFIAAWASLEIFAHKLFAAHFNRVLPELGPRNSGRDGNLYKRLTQTPAEEVAIEDCFAFLAVWLSKNSEADRKLFARLNEARNDLYHRGVAARHLPSWDAINLFRKYLALAREALGSRNAPS